MVEANSESRIWVSMEALVKPYSVYQDEWSDLLEYLRLHEEAHKAAAGDYAIGDIEYNNRMVSEGYELSGRVRLAVSVDPAKPEASLANMQALARIALAPAKPSQDDHIIAKTAWYMERQIRKGDFPDFFQIYRDYQDCYACADHYAGTFCAHGDECQQRKDEGMRCSQTY